MAEGNQVIHHRKDGGRWPPPPPLLQHIHLILPWYGGIRLTTVHNTIIERRRRRGYSLGVCPEAVSVAAVILQICSPTEEENDFLTRWSLVRIWGRHAWDNTVLDNIMKDVEASWLAGWAIQVGIHLIESVLFNALWSLINYANPRAKPTNRFQVASS